MAEIKRTATTVEERLRLEIADLKAGVTFHLHEPRNGSGMFRCTSPYCDDLGAAEPKGPPPDYAPAERYRRDHHA